MEALEAKGELVGQAVAALVVLAGRAVAVMVVLAARVEVLAVAQAHPESPAGDSQRLSSDS